MPITSPALMRMLTGANVVPSASRPSASWLKALVVAAEDRWRNCAVEPHNGEVLQRGGAAGLRQDHDPVMMNEVGAVK
jgi:hypothetical protein